MRGVDVAGQEAIMAAPSSRVPLSELPSATSRVDHTMIESLTPEECRWLADLISPWTRDDQPRVEIIAAKLRRMTEQEAPLPAVAGRLDRTIADFERACLVHLAEEQARPNPDNALIAVLCDAVRLARESGPPLITLAPDILAEIEQVRVIVSDHRDATYKLGGLYALDTLRQALSWPLKEKA